MDPEELPPLPVINLPAVFRARETLQADIFDRFIGVLIEGPAFAQLVALLQRAFRSGGPVDHFVLQASVQHLLGRELQPAAARDTAWRLAGNVARLRDGQAAGPWLRQTAPEWVPIQVVAARYAIQKSQAKPRGRPGRTMRFRVLAGTPCPEVITQFWSNEKLRVLGGVTGFARKAPMHMADNAELMSFRFLGLIEPRLCERGPGFYHVACPPAMVDGNRRLIRMRRRIRFACPQGFEHGCHQCPLGALACEAATHPADYEVKACPGCGRDWWFDTDPGFVNDYCVYCQPLASAGIPLKRID